MTREIIRILNNIDILYGKLNRMARNGDAITTTIKHILSLETELVRLTVNRHVAMDMLDPDMPLERFLSGWVIAVCDNNFTIVTDDGPCVDVPFNRILDMTVIQPA
ncbi:MAG: hypothetical protein JRN19_03320 [Nitrososphaerota archaeon]|nr:hypothetical protein [Nitrososphaerota archaeon]MDG7051461.1 hypothetical protein [Nitrososphaerota archaeon]